MESDETKRNSAPSVKVLENACQRTESEVRRLLDIDTDNFKEDENQLNEHGSSIKKSFKDYHNHMINLIISHIQNG
jgi:hypothetical protein